MKSTPNLVNYNLNIEGTSSTSGTSKFTIIRDVRGRIPCNYDVLKSVGIDRL